MRKYVIMAGGDGSRWEHYLGLPKHLISIHGERLIDRTVRLLNDNHQYDITILGPKIHDPRYNVLGARLWETTGLPDCFWELLLTDVFNTEDIYVLLGGDVFYSEAVIKATVEPHNQYRFIGQLMPNFGTGQLHEEIWSISYDPEYRDLLKACLDKAIEKNPDASAWDVYRMLSPDKPDLFQVIMDETTDMDTPYDYEHWMARFGKEA